jgi:hypothetical protein
VVLSWAYLFVHCIKFLGFCLRLPPWCTMCSLTTNSNSWPPTNIVLAIESKMCIHLFNIQFGFWCSNLVVEREGLQVGCYRVTHIFTVSTTTCHACYYLVCAWTSTELIFGFHRGNQFCKKLVSYI